MAHSLNLKKSTHRKGQKLPIGNLNDVSTEGGDHAVQGILMVHVAPLAGPPKWVLLKADTVQAIKGIGDFTPADEGIHTVFLVTFDKGNDGKFRFLAHQSDPIHVIA